MLACLQSAGSRPVSTECWKMQVSPSASSVAHSFKTWLGMLSGPTALEMLFVWKRCFGNCLSILRSGIGEYVGSDSSDDGARELSLVKTDWNC